MRKGVKNNILYPYKKNKIRLYNNKGGVKGRKPLRG